eukprot:gene18743-21956_t
MKLIYSSFFVGFITSMTVSYDIGEKLLERRFASKQIYLTNEEELDARRYQRKLRERVNEYQSKQEDELRKEARLFLKDYVVTPIQNGVTTTFSFDPKKLIESLNKKD